MDKIFKNGTIVVLEGDLHTQMRVVGYVSILGEVKYYYLDDNKSSDYLCVEKELVHAYPVRIKDWQKLGGQKISVTCTKCKGLILGAREDMKVCTCKTMFNWPEHWLAKCRSH